MCRQAQDPGPPGSLRGRHCPLPGRDDGMGPGFLAWAQDSVRGGLGGCGAGVCSQSEGLPWGIYLYVSNPAIMPLTPGRVEWAGSAPVFSGWDGARTDQSPGVYEPRGWPPEPSGGMVWGWRCDPKIPGLDGWAGAPGRALLRVPSACWVFTMLTAARRLGSSSP